MKEEKKTGKQKKQEKTEKEANKRTYRQIPKETLKKKQDKKLQNTPYRNQKGEFAALPENIKNRNGQNSRGENGNNRNQEKLQGTPKVANPPHHRILRSTAGSGQRRSSTATTTPQSVTSSPSGVPENENGLNRNEEQVVVQNPQNAYIPSNPEVLGADEVYTTTKIAVGIATPAPPKQSKTHVKTEKERELIETSTRRQLEHGYYPTTEVPETGMTFARIGHDLQKFYSENQPWVLLVVVVFVSILCFMGCLCATWRWIYRWIRQKFSRKSGELVRTPDEEYERLLINEHPRPSTRPSTLGAALASLESESRRRNNEPDRTKWDEYTAKSVKDYEDSLKPSEEEIRQNSESQEKLRALREEIKAMKIERAEMKKKHESESSSFAGSFDDAERIDLELRKSLNEQNRKFEEKLKIMREERARKEKEADEELNRMRYETQLSIAAFLACIQLRIRFNEQREEWGDSLKRLRQPLINVENSYYDLQDEMKTYDPSDDFSKSCFQNEGVRFAKKLEDAQNMLLVAFNNLDKLSMDFEDKIFIRMIMKSCSDEGQVCDSIGYKLIEVLKSPDPDMKWLDKAVGQLNPHNIPTTETLSKNAPFASEEDLRVIETVPTPDWILNLN